MNNSHTTTDHQAQSYLLPLPPHHLQLLVVLADGFFFPEPRWAVSLPVGKKKHLLPFARSGTGLSIDYLVNLFTLSIVLILYPWSEYASLQGFYSCLFC